MGMSIAQNKDNPPRSTHGGMQKTNYSEGEKVLDDCYGRATIKNKFGLHVPLFRIDLTFFVPTVQALDARRKQDRRVYPYARVCFLRSTPEA